MPSSGSKYNISAKKERKRKIIGKRDAKIITNRKKRLEISTHAQNMKH